MKKEFKYLILTLNIFLFSNVFAKEGIEINQEISQLELLDLPDEMLLNIIEKLFEALVKKCMNDWCNILEFDQEFKKKELYQKVMSLRLINCRFGVLYNTYIDKYLINTINRLKKERSKYLIDKMKKSNTLDQNELDSALVKILNKQVSNKEFLYEAVKLILIGANPNICGISGQTTLMKVCYYSDTYIVELLIQAGADVTIRDDMNETALFKAIKAGQKDIALILIDHDQDFSIKNLKSLTVLSLALVRSDKEIVEKLIKKIANMKAQS